MSKTDMVRKETNYEKMVRQFMETKEKFLSTFKPSLDADDYVQSRDIKLWCERKGINYSYYSIKWMMTHSLHFEYTRSKQIDRVRFTGYLNCIMDEDNIVNLNDEDYYIDYCVDMKVDEMVDYCCSNLLMGTPNY